MRKKQVFSAFKYFSPLKSSKIQQELFGCFFNKSNSVRATLVATKIRAVQDQVLESKYLSGSARPVFASQKRNKLFFSLSPEKNSFKPVGFRYNYAIRAGTVSLTRKANLLFSKGGCLLCKSDLKNPLLGQKTEKCWKLNQRSWFTASLNRLTGTSFRFCQTSKALSAKPEPALPSQLVSEAVLAVNNLRKVKKKIICKFKSQRSGEIFKEPFIDNFLTEVDQIAFGAPFKLLPRKLASQNNSNKLHLSVKLGDYVNCGDQIGENDGTPLIVNSSGKIIKISNKQIILQKTQPVLYYSQANVHVKKDEWVIQGAPILTLTHQTLVTGDIVQGIPRIEQLFEAPNSPPPGMRGGHYLHQTLHTQIREIFRKNWIQAPLPTAVRLSLQQIQQILVESIQKVYLSQGVLIADKHVEIIVRQMSSKAEVLDGGNTGLLLEELLPVELIENTNIATPGKKALYAPAVVGLTRSALESDSFISAASFQETTRVLSRDAIIGKSDFLRGLKEKVVIGDLISAGTGLDIYFVYTLLANTLAT